MEGDHVKAPPRFPPPGYRVLPGRFKSAFLDNGLFIETMSGLLSYGRPGYVGCEPPPAQRSPRDIIVSRDGTPADSSSNYLLKRAMSDYFSVLDGKRYEEPVPPISKDISALSPAEQQKFYDTLLTQQGMPPELAPIGYVLQEVDLDSEPGQFQKQKRRQSRRRLSAPPRTRERRWPPDLPPSDWCRWLTCRFAVVFALKPTDARVRRLAKYFTDGGSWTRWKTDPDLRPLLEQRKKDPRTMRLFRIVESFALRRASRIHGQKEMGAPIGLTVGRGRRRLRFAWPLGASGRAFRKQQLAQRLIFRHLPYICSQPWYRDKFLAAAMWIGRDFLVEWGMAIEPPLTQDKIAHYFKFTRRQLTRAIALFKRPDFANDYYTYIKRCDSAKLIKKPPP